MEASRGDARPESPALRILRPRSLRIAVRRTSEDSCQPGEDHHDSFDDTGDADVIAGLPILEGGFLTYPAQDHNA